MMTMASSTALLSSRASDLMTIVIDTREQTPWHFPSEVPTTTAALRSGDYSIAGHESKIAIERKTLDDFVACCGRDRGRFARELERLAEFDRAAVIVEANLRDVWNGAARSRMQPPSIAGSAASFFIDHGVPTFFCSDRWSAADFALRLLRIFYQRACAKHAAAVSEVE